MSKYRIKAKPYLFHSGELGAWYCVQKEIFGLFWWTLKDFTRENMAREYLANKIELKKRKVKILEVIEEK